VEVNDTVSEPALIEKFELRVDVVWQGALAFVKADQATLGGHKSEMTYW
jgi:O-acetylhomoserine/O-acetylserine sulfhydrylase-like pyridoxal-dependent enzyme